MSSRKNEEDLQLTEWSDRLVPKPLGHHWILSSLSKKTSALKKLFFVVVDLGRGRALLELVGPMAKAPKTLASDLSCGDFLVVKPRETAETEESWLKDEVLHTQKKAPEGASS